MQKAHSTVVLKMKFVLLLAFVAVCHGYPQVSTRSLNIDDAGTIVITGDNGKKIIISKTAEGNGQQNIDISVSGPNGVTKRLLIDDNDVLSEVSVFGKGGDSDVSVNSQRDNSNEKRQSTQGETVVEILGQYQGDVDDVTYQQLLTQINAAVQSGQLDGLFYEVLKNLGQDQSQNQQKQVYNQQQIQDITGNQLQKQRNILDLLLKKDVQPKYAQQYQQGVQRYNGVPVSIMTPNGQQQSLIYKQAVYNPYEQQEGMLVGNTVVLPGMDTQSQIIAQVGLEQPQVVAYSPTQGLVYGLTRSTGPAVSNVAYITSTGPNNDKTTLVQVPVEELFDTYGTQNLQRSELNQFLQKERELLDQQRQMQQQNQQGQQTLQRYQQQQLVQQFGREQQQMQQQMQQQRQQQIQQQMQQQRQQQIQQQMQQQRQQQMQQKMQQQIQQQMQQKMQQQRMNQQQYQVEQRLRQQQYFQQQQQQPFTYFLSTSPRQNGIQQVLLQQQQRNAQQQYSVPLVVY